MNKKKIILQYTNSPGTWLNFVCRLLYLFQFTMQMKGATVSFRFSYATSNIHMHLTEQFSLHLLQFPQSLSTWFFHFYHLKSNVWFACISLYCFFLSQFYLFFALYETKSIAIGRSLICWWFKFLFLDFKADHIHRFVYYQTMYIKFKETIYWIE